MGSSLTGERTKKDPAFEGFRKSSNRLKQASPIAGSLYKMIPQEVKQFALYRTLTGDAIKMLKEGMEEALIKETLKKKYIDPLLDAPEEKSERRIPEPVKRERVKGMRDFISYPQMPAGVRKMTRTKRAFLLQKVLENPSEFEHLSPVDSDPPRHTLGNISEPPMIKPEVSQDKKPRRKTTTGLIYLGRLPECKKLKIWLRPLLC